VERLAYTQTQAAALGISRSTLVRRVLPFVETIEVGWSTYLIPVDELGRFASERRQKTRADRRPTSARPGRKVALGVEVATCIRDAHAAGKSLAEIARGLNADAVPTSQGGRQWWPSTVRAVLVRSTPPESAAGRSSDTSSRTSASTGPVSKPTTNRTPSASASRSP
jgi:hypothetical protein